MEMTISAQDKEKIFTKLSQANLAFQKAYPGDRPDKQPIHTVYGGADLFKHDLAPKMGEVALKSFRRYAPNFVTLGKVLELEGHESLPIGDEKTNGLIAELEGMDESDQKRHSAWLPFTVYNKVIEKLKKEAVEDFRIDFEDGFGNRSDQEEDEAAQNAARELAKGMEMGVLPPFIGIRIKPFTEDLKERGLRTLDIFVSTLASLTKGKLPDNFVVMLPKVTIPQQIKSLVQFFEILETTNGIPGGSLKMEMMVETTQSLLDQEGKNNLLNLIEAGNGRCIANHFGTYDYTASHNITAKYQDMGHQVCDMAHNMMKIALAGTGIWLSDGATNLMPIGPHRGTDLSPDKEEENTRVVHKAWKKGYDHIRHSLYKGFYQGWDLHPAQLPMRYAAVYSFFLESYEDAASRLGKFMAAHAKATLTGDIFDDAATGQGLLNYFLKGLNSGALSEEQVFLTGLTLEEIKSRSFFHILQSRKEASK